MMLSCRLRCLLCCIFAILTTGHGTNGQDAKSRVDKQNPQYLLPLPEAKLDAKIPTSKSVLRYAWGDDISSHAQVEVYLRALAKAAPTKTKLVQYGTSQAGRSLSYLVISSPENIAKLPTVQANNLKLADPRTIKAEQAKSLIENSPAVIWLAYCVHGNEISPTDAALLTAYHLVADTRPETKKLLEDLVVIIDPLQNPDGRDRFVNAYRDTRGVFDQPHKLANERAEVWPRGRSNHYWFDMNRDWFRHSQKEVKHKVAAYLDWNPQIYVDAHEMGSDSTFYFPPPTEPKNPFLLPKQHQWFGKLGKYQASWFDKYGFGYMTREVFDAFYPGYGSEWPTLQGGLGVLWEQASARGRVVNRSDQTRLTYHDGVRNHYISGIATLLFAAKNRMQLLQNFYDTKKSAIQLGIDGPVKHYFVPRKNRPQRSVRFVQMLRRNGIEVRVLNKDLSVECTDIKNAETTLRVIPKGSFHIPVAQPTARLLRALLDRKVEMDEKFLRRQLERNQLRLPDEIYDVTAWSMPLAFDVQCLALGTTSQVDSVAWKPGQKSASKVANAKIAYLIPGTDGAIRVTSELIKQNIRVHVSDEKFRINGTNFERGTLIVKIAGNPAGVHDAVKKVCQKYSVAAFPTDTAFVESGAHMGGPKVKWVRPPKVLLVVNRPTNYSSGHTWHLFDHVLNYPTTRVRGTDLQRVNLSKFNIVVLPDGRYGSTSGFGESTAKKLNTWIASGGTLITLRGATEWAAGEKVKLIKNQIIKRVVSPAKKSTDKDATAKPEKVTPDNVPGAFFRANVFQKHWVTFGSRPNFDAFYSGRLILSPTSETAGRSLVSFEKRDKLLTSGFCWPTSLDLLAETPYVVYRRVGRGNVIAFTDDPNFRAMYPALQRLFINAVMFGPAHASID